MFLLYNRSTRPTGRILAAYLGISHGTTPPDIREDNLVRWGNTGRMRFIPRSTLNRREAIEKASNKFVALTEFSDAGLQTPTFSRDPLPLSLLRSDKGFGGTDIEFIFQTVDAPENSAGKFYSKYIPKAREFRVHVFSNRIIKTQEKIIPDDAHDYDPVAWNGNYFRHIGFENLDPRARTMAINAVATLGLDFGAVDLILGEDRQYYILEVNTAPGLTTRNSIESYGNALARSLNLTDIPCTLPDELEAEEIGA